MSRVMRVIQNEVSFVKLEPRARPSPECTLVHAFAGATP